MLAWLGSCSLKVGAEGPGPTDSRSGMALGDHVNLFSTSQRCWFQLEATLRVARGSEESGVDCVALPAHSAGLQLHAATVKSLKPFKCI